MTGPPKRITEAPDRWALELVSIYGAYEAQNILDQLLHLARQADITPYEVMRRLSNPSKHHTLLVTQCFAD